jgi:Predicted nucleoside-diphosphate sugar epimerase
METAFVTGATGVLGRGTVGRLLDAGHPVRALARNAERASVISAMGAEPVVADIYDVDAMTRAMSGAESVLHLATRIPAMTRARKASAWAENTRLRAVGTKVLVDAALASGVGRVIAESITFIYRDGGSDWLDEQSPVEATAGLESVVTLEGEVARFAAAGGTGIALRFGSFYGSDARSTDEYLQTAARRIAPVLGSADAYLSSIHTHDAANAVVASFAAPAGVYNVVDDVPLSRREFTDAFAHAFGFRHLRILSPALVRIAGGSAAQAVLRSQRVRNVALRRATGWAPAISSAVEGWAAVAAAKEASHA